MTSFNGSGGQYAFTFTQPSRDIPLLGNCRHYRVIVRYTAFPFAREGSYPTRLDTQEAAGFLGSAADSGSLVNFGYLGGSGLTATGAACTYTAKAMAFTHHGGKSIVFAYSNPI